MRLRRLCKSAGSSDDDDCPAMYLAENPALMVGQGNLLDAATTAELQNLATSEGAVFIPTETVLRAAALFLAERGRTGVLAEVEAYLAEIESGEEAR